MNKRKKPQRESAKLLEQAKKFLTVRPEWAYYLRDRWKKEAKEQGKVKP